MKKLLICLFLVGGCASEEAGKNLTNRYIIPEHTTNLGGGSVMVANSEIVVPNAASHTPAREVAATTQQEAALWSPPCPRASRACFQSISRECQNRRFRTRPGTEALDPYTKKKFLVPAALQGDATKPTTEAK